MIPFVQKFAVTIFILIGLFLPIQTPLEFAFWRALIIFIADLIVLTLTLYVAGLIIVGGERTKLPSAFAIALLGTFVNFALNVVFVLLSINFSWEYMLVFRVLLSFIVWLSLIKNFYKTGWLGAFAVAILALIIMVVLEILLVSFLIALRILV
jgi:hypothetical protein